MSRVWAARLRGTRGFQKLVAIKTLVAEGPNHEMLERMLLAEARLAAQIQHPNVAQYQDLGERDGVLYVVMEWVDGESLAVLHKQAAAVGGLPLRIAAQILAQACHGLHFAHELKDDAGESLRLVHCDVSPHNIMISGTGAVKVIDFGIAKAKSGAPLGEDAMLAGKLAFMAPEQAKRGAKVDRRADIFSLGILAYQLTTGRHPFGAGTPAETIQRVMRNAPIIPPCAANPKYPAALERVVMKALAHKPEDRFDNAMQMMQELALAVPDLAHEVDVCAFMQHVCAESLRDRRALVADALKAAAAREEGMTRGPMQSIALSTASIPPSVRGATSTGAPSTNSVIVEGAPPMRRSRWLAWGAASAALALALFGLRYPGPLRSFLVTTPQHERSAAHAPAALPASPPPPAAELPAVPPALAPPVATADTAAALPESAEPVADSPAKRGTKSGAAAKKRHKSVRAPAASSRCVGPNCAAGSATPAAPAGAPAKPSESAITEKYGI